MERQRFLGLAAVAVICAALGIGPALAIGGGNDDDEKAKNPDYATAVKLIKSGKHKDAIPLLKRVAAKEPKNADVQNYLGYTHRKLKRFDAALGYYLAALKIKPKHLGANEYLGELYLETGRLAKAEQRLKVLDDACFFGCEEHRELKAAIAAYKARKGKGS